MKKSLLHRLVLAPALALAMLALHAAPAPMRLGEAATPKRYELELSVDPNADSHSGHVEIELQLNQPLKQLRLNGYGLNVRRAQLVVGNRKLRARVSMPDKQLLQLAFGESVPPGPARLLLDFTGQISKTEIEGIFRQQDGGNWYAFTQFEAVGARHAFPCFDEPGWKVPWQLSLKVPRDDVAVANTPVVSEKDLGDGTKLVRFAETRPLPSYLLAFGVGPFDVVDGGKVGNVPLRYITPKGRASEARYAREATPAIVQALKGYFGMPYPYEKLDSLVIPLTMTFSAMENAGLITYVSPVMLAKPHEETARFKRHYVAIAAHELSHQWFGNYVTMRWWDDLWLNESFASWMGDKITAQVRPDWHWDLSGVVARSHAMALDRLPSTRQIHQPVESLDDLGNAFDDVTYSKGQAVLTMFEGWLGEARFQKGVQRYLQQHAWGNATAADFIGALAQEDAGVAQAFKSFIEQPGIPRLGVALSCDPTPRLTLKQSRFVPRGIEIKGEQQWEIPNCFSYLDGARTVRTCTLLDLTELHFDSMQAQPGAVCPQWVQANPEGRGYYRPVYWPGGLMSLMEEMSRLSASEAYAGLDDARALIESGDLPAADALRLAARYVGYPRREVVEHTRAIVLSVWELIEPAQRPLLARYIQQTYGPRVAELGATPKAGEGDDAEILRSMLVPLLGDQGDDAALRQQAAVLADAWLRDHRAVPASMVEPALQLAAIDGDAARFERYLDAALREPDMKVRRQLLKALGGFRQPALLARALGLLLDTRLDAREALSVVWGAADSVQNRQAAWQFVTAHFDAIAARLPRDLPGEFPGYFPVCDADARAAMESFFRERIARFDGGTRELAHALERADLCMAAKTAQSGSLSGFLAGYQAQLLPQ
ncbi:M1 family aminopeptidase [Chitinivorax sp. PXF-14]|uniref:M1 family metallopeptidase n=1 Tax=Chitinivorax sp. PXF-14 TaxID=3230488 RepID=UPI003465901D